MLFTIALTQVASTLLFILPGFLLKKFNKLHEDHLSGLSAVLIYVCSPCLIVSSFFSLEFSWQKLGQMGLFFLITLVLQALFILLAFLFIKDKTNARARVAAVAGALGNVGFFGLPLIRALLPNNPEVATFSSVYIFSMNVLVFTVGVFCLTGDKKFVSLKPALLNPSTIAFTLGLILFACGVSTKIPALFSSAITLLGNMSTALCMIILGGRLATVSLKQLFCTKEAYVAVVFKLIAFPLFCYAAVYFLPLEFSFKASVLILSGAPCGSIIVSLAEIHKSEPHFSAVCVLLATICCIATIPLLSLLL